MSIANLSLSSIVKGAICFDGDDIIVGDEAKAIQALGSYDTAAFFKRQMGDENFLLSFSSITERLTSASKNTLSIK